MPRRRAIKLDMRRDVMVCACGYREGPWTGLDIIRARTNLHLKAGFCLTAGPVEIFWSRLVERVEEE